MKTLNLKKLEESLCQALGNNLGNIKLAPLLKKDQATMRVSQRYMLYYALQGGTLNDQSNTISCKKPRKITYTIRFVFELKDIRNHQTIYDCIDELFNLIDGLNIGLPFSCISLTSFSEPEFLDDGAYYRWGVEGTVNSFTSTKSKSLRC